jgi:anaerobic ribonucleoside-triphosphate reductase activating protein
VRGLTLLGGEPFEPQNQPALVELLRQIKSAYPEKTVWVWTGYLWEDVASDLISSEIDVVVDGRFIEALKDLRLPYCGSSNQRIIDIKKSTADSITLYK